MTHFLLLVKVEYEVVSCHSSSLSGLQLLFALAFLASVTTLGAFLTTIKLLLACLAAAVGAFSRIFSLVVGLCLVVIRFGH